MLTWKSLQDMLFSDKKQAAQKRCVLEGCDLFPTESSMCKYGEGLCKYGGGLEGYALSVVTV